MHAAVEELGVGLSLTLAIVMGVRVGVVETAVDLGVVQATVEDLGVGLSLTLAIVMAVGVGEGVEVRVGVVSIRRVSATVEVIVGVGLSHGGSHYAKKDESLHGRYDAVPCCHSRRRLRNPH